VILNGTDHSPYVFIDRVILESEGDNVFKGLRFLMDLVGAKRGIVGINNPEGIFLDKLTKLALDEDVWVVPLKTVYTRGMGRLLSRDISKTLKMDLGKSMVSRVPTARAVYEALANRRPFVELYVSVYGAAKLGAPRVRIGTRFHEIIQALGGYQKTPERIFMNSPMTGIAQYTDEVSVVRSTYGITVQYEVAEEAPGPCIRCSQCVDACPVNLLPNVLALYSRKEKFGECRKYHVFACIECGYCSYTCPSKIPLMQLIRYAKSNLEARA
jgi:electron transport complex protein RnfC